MTLPASGVISFGSINTELTLSATAQITLDDTAVRTLAGIPTSGSQIAISDLYGKTYSSTVVADKGIFGFGTGSVMQNVTNLVSNTGVVATDTTGVGTVRQLLAACGYGGDKGIFGYGVVTSTLYSLKNLVSNTGVVATDTAGVGTARAYLAACGYGTDKGIFGYGNLSNTIATLPYQSLTNLVSNTGVVATDTTGVGSARAGLSACGYSTDKGIFGYGYYSNVVGGGVLGGLSVTNLVSNTGVVATDTAGVGTSRWGPAACKYGTDKGIFGYGIVAGTSSNISNLVSNTGVVATDTAGVGSSRSFLAACGYSTDKGIFGYGYYSLTYYSLKNLVSNTGVVATDTTGVGTARAHLAACSY